MSAVAARSALREARGEGPYKGAEGVYLKVVREWAQANGVPVSGRGRVTPRVDAIAYSQKQGPCQLLIHPAPETAAPRENVLPTGAATHPVGMT